MVGCSMAQGDVGLAPFKVIHMALFPIELGQEEIQASIKRLTEFCSQHSWRIEYSNKRKNQYHDKVITLYAQRKLEILYYIFLHEIGHAWMLECDFTYQDRYPELVRKPLRYATVTYKIAKVQEEIEAWEVGKKLARSLCLRINEAKFEKIRAECLTSYMNWAARPRKGRKKRDGIISANINISDNSSSGYGSFKESG